MPVHKHSLFGGKPYWGRGAPICSTVLDDPGRNCYVYCWKKALLPEVARSFMSEAVGETGAGAERQSLLDDEVSLHLPLLLW